MHGHEQARLIGWTPVVPPRNTLKGFVTVAFPSGMLLHEIPIHVAGSRQWASPPHRPWIKGNALMLDNEGRVKWTPIITFHSRLARLAWSQTILTALAREYPEALADNAGTQDDVAA
jgi:hypothetical protein